MGRSRERRDRSPSGTGPGRIPALDRPTRERCDGPHRRAIFWGTRASLSSLRHAEPVSASMVRPYPQAQHFCFAQRHEGDGLGRNDSLRRIREGAPAKHQSQPYRIMPDTNEMRASIAASPHYPVMSLGHASISCIPARFSFDRRSAKRGFAVRAGTIRRRFGRVRFGARPHLESPSSSCPTSAEAVVFPKRWTAFQLPGRVRFNSWESSRSVVRPSVDFVIDPVRSLQAGLATTLDVPAAHRLVVR